MNLSRMRYLVLFAAISAPLLLSASAPALRAPQDPKVLTAAEPPAGAIWLDSLDLTRMVQRRGTPRAGKSGSGRGNNPPPLSLAGVTYQHGIGTLSINELIVDLKGQATRFESMIGIDDAASKGQGSVTYEIWLDNKRAFISPRDEGGRRRRSSCRWICRARASWSCSSTTAAT